MNHIVQLQNRLKLMFCFRFFVLAISLFGLFGIPYCSESMKNILIGISGSGIVWSAVELFDLIVTTYSKYVVEKNEFRSDIIKEIRNIRKIFIQYKTPEEIPWKDVDQCTTKLFSVFSAFNAKSSVFVLTKEWENMHNYIERLYWKTNSCVFHQISFTNDKKGELFKIFICTEIKKEQCKNSQIFALQEHRWSSVSIRYQQMRDIEVNTTPLPRAELPLEKIKDYVREDSKCDDDHRITSYFTLNLYKIFEQEIISIKRTCAPKLIWELVFRRLKKYD